MKCEHVKNFQVKEKPKGYVCEECVPIGDEWVHLRTCQECGATLCCDSSPNQHMTNHFHKTGHALVISAEPNEYWVYCYKDEGISKYDPQ